MIKNHNNPFRNEKTCVNNPRNAYNTFDKLGRSFKSNNFQLRGDSKEFNKYSKKNQYSNPDELNDKERDWGKVKFNPVAAVATGQATPWIKFKHEMLKNNDQEGKTNQDSANGDKRQHAKDQLHKKKIAEIQNLPTPKWEDFGEVNTPKKSVKREGSKASDNRKMKNQTALIDDDCLRNFDSKKLNFAQNNKLRKIITGATLALSQQGSLSKTLKGLRNRNKRRNER